MSNPKEKDIRRGRERFKEVWEDTSQCRLPLVNRPALRCAIKLSLPCLALLRYALALFRFGLQCPCKSLLVGALLCRGPALLIHAHAVHHSALLCLRHASLCLAAAVRCYPLPMQSRALLCRRSCLCGAKPMPVLAWLCLSSKSHR